jgi:hypothetical protein
VKFLYVLLIFMALFGLYAYWRLRPYIKAVRQIFGAARGARRVSERPANDGTIGPRDEGRPAEKLVRCASCDTWLPASRAVSPGGSGAQFCSHACLEGAADERRHARKSAS